MNSPVASATLACLAAALLPAAVQAQSPPAAPAGDAARELQSITVTAERSAGNAREVPMAISVLSGEMMDTLQASGETIISLSGRVPSLNAETSSGRSFPRFFLRGYGNSDFQVNSSQPVSLVYDDVVQENAYLKGFPVFDVSQVEVLRGPQGTLFGRNSPGGVIKFDSVAPQRQREGYASITAGNLGTLNLEGAVNQPLGADWAARVSFLHQHRDDWVTNLNPAAPQHRLEGYDDAALRLQALYKPGGAFDALFNLHARDLQGSQRLFRANAITPGTNDLEPGFDPRRIAIDAGNGATLRSHGGSARLNWTWGDIELHSITGFEGMNSYARGDIDGGISAAAADASTAKWITPFASETSAALPDLRQWSQELRLASRYRGPLNWQAGIYLFDERYTFVTEDLDSTNGGALIDRLRFAQHTRSQALFGSLAWRPQATLKLQGGLRYTRDSKRFDTREVQGLVLSGPTAVDRDDSKLSWDASATWTPDRSTSWYVRAGNAYRGTSVQPPSAFAVLSVAQPETSTSIEAGVKADLLERRARLALSVFRYEVKDQQLSVIGGSSNANSLINSRKSIGQGAEVELQALVGERLSVNLGASVNRTRLDDPTLRVSACGNGCTVLDPVVAPADPAQGRFAPIVSIDGNPLPQAPRYMLNLSARYSMPLGAYEAYLAGDVAWRDSMNLFLYESAEYRARPSTQLGLRAGLLWGQGCCELAAFVRNATNQIRITGGVDFNNLTAMTTDPRTYGLQARFSY